MEECKYEQKTIKIEKHIHDHLENSDSISDCNDETESDFDNDESDE